MWFFKKRLIGKADLKYIFQKDNNLNNPYLIIWNSINHTFFSYCTYTMLTVVDAKTYKMIHID